MADGRTVSYCLISIIFNEVMKGIVVANSEIIKQKLKTHCLEPKDDSSWTTRRKALRTRQQLKRKYLFMIGIWRSSSSLISNLISIVPFDGYGDFWGQYRGYKVYSHLVSVKHTQLLANSRYYFIKNINF